MTLSDFLKEVSVRRSMYGWRLGQAVVNTAEKSPVYAEKAKTLTGTPVDCYYFDSRVWEYLKALGIPG